MNDASLAAYIFAKQHHGNQMYDGMPYVDTHVQQVVHVLRDHGLGGGNYEIAGWLHDVVEDCAAVTIGDIHAQFGNPVGDLVWAVTGVGKDRGERNLSIYMKIAAYPLAASLKVADRIANLEASKTGSGHLLMYRRESNTFERAVAPFTSRQLMDRLNLAYKYGL